MVNIWGRSFWSFKNRLGYLGESVLYLLLSWAWAQDHISYLSLNSGIFTRVSGITFEFVLALICTVRWTMGVWLRACSIGLQRWVASAFSIAVIILWVFFIRSALHLWLLLALFLILQIPLLALPLRADRTTRAGYPTHDSPTS
jgi:hypothetical protein